MSSFDAQKRSLSLLKNLLECAENIKHGRPLTSALCYVPSVYRFKVASSGNIDIYSEHRQGANKIKTYNSSRLQKDVIFVFSGDEHNNEDGQWLKVVKVIEGYPKAKSEKKLNSEGWVLMSDKKDLLVAVDEVKGKVTVNNWMNVMSMSSDKSSSFDVISPHKEAVESLRIPPTGWNIQCDEDLVRFLKQLDQLTEPETSIWKHIESVTVSSESDMKDCLTDEKPETCWESDGRSGSHWIKLKMKKRTIIKGLMLVLDSKDGNYMPHNVLVIGYNGGVSTNLNRYSINNGNITEVTDVTILEDVGQFYEEIEIKILECHARGIDTRIHGIKIRSNTDVETHVSLDLFKSEKLSRYPLLEGFTTTQLAHRSTVLLRFGKLFDSCLGLVAPRWQYTAGTFDKIWDIRQVLTLSRKRLDLFGMFLMDSESKSPSMPKLMICRRKAADHRENPSRDPSFRNSLFRQLFDRLRVNNSGGKTPFDYRWSGTFNQWWECKFIGEGVIDQGGGFRDSLCDLAAELNPLDSNAPIPLPFFIPTPNQMQYDSNVHRDTYIPNPGCHLFYLYEWIGQLMGACIRSRQHLVLSLPRFFWKILTGERITWTEDYRSVDEAEVETIRLLSEVEDEEAWSLVADSRTWSIVLCDGTSRTIAGHRENEPVQFRQKKEYIKAIKRIRMRESIEQIKAIQKGLLNTVPEAALQLITWSELEEYVCGSPDIPMSKLKTSLHCKERGDNEQQVKQLYTVLERFTNEDRSQFLRFVTGRRRLPVDIRVEFSSDFSTDSLPRSSTCGNALYLPRYTSADIAEKRIRYAIYNCVAIDTDGAPI